MQRDGGEMKAGSITHRSLRLKGRVYTNTHTHTHKLNIYTLKKHI